MKLRYIPLPNFIPGPTGDPITATEGLRPPCRRCLQDAIPGEVVVLRGYDPFPENSISPYRGSGPIFVHAHECKTFDGSKIPERQLRRMMSVRAYNKDDIMVAAKITKGDELEEVAGRMLADEKAGYINVHNALPGCFAFRIERA